MFSNSAVAASELGLVSDILHRFGNDVANYPGQEFKNILGLILFSCIATFLYILGHYWAGFVSKSSARTSRS